MNNPCTCQTACCGFSVWKSSEEFLTGKSIPKASTQLTWKDRWGAIKVRFGIGRMKYVISPGLYKVGEPDATSPVLVTANYKLSFDYLRSHLKEIHAWILVLDTRGINVWCAAGGGLFSTEELIRRIQKLGLANIVQHRKLILPQLSAPGVSAHEVTRVTGFKIQYGPVDARDIGNYLKNGEKAFPEMRKVQFPLKKRLAFIPMELIHALKFSPLFLLGTWALACLHHQAIVLFIPREFWLCVAAMLAGSVVFQIILPIFPFRSFILNGWILGIVILFGTGILVEIKGWYLLSLLFLLSPVTAYLAFQFTGATPFTSLSGVEKEFKYGIPPLWVSVMIGIFLQMLF